MLPLYTLGEHPPYTSNLVTAEYESEQLYTFPKSEKFAPDQLPHDAGDTFNGSLLHNNAELAEFMQCSIEIKTAIATDILPMVISLIIKINSEVGGWSLKTIN